MKHFNTSPRELLASFWRNRELITTLTKRDILSRYKGSVLGLFWSFFQPVLMLIIYTFVFSVVFKARWSSESSSTTEFALVLFSGLIVFNFFSECILKAPTLVISQPNYVKKVIFPLEILPWVSLGAALFQLLMSASVWLLCYIVLFGIPHATLLFFPFMMLPVALLALGLSWMISSLGVYLRDIGYVMSILMTIMMFLSPIFYPITALPEQYQIYLKINPLAHAIEEVRDVLYWGTVPNIISYAVLFLVSLACAWIGFIWFQKTRKGFADVL
ncbi:MAG: ABC transporter permease [Legionella sp.]|uniref:ABC transporter permease n=1 Tax=Legionella sp. TaxID=459 RepID=UPI0039E35BC2